jgi:hypothetical protein
MWLVSCKGDSQPLLAGPLAVVAGQQQQQQLQLLLSSQHCLDFRAGVCLPELYLHSGSTCIFRLAVHHGADRAARACGAAASVGKAAPVLAEHAHTLGLDVYYPCGCWARLG